MKLLTLDDHVRQVVKSRNVCYVMRSLTMYSIKRGDLNGS